MEWSPFRDLVRHTLAAIWSTHSEWDVDREVASLGVMKFRRGTDADRAAAIAAARDRIANLRNQTFAGYQLGAVASAISFDEAMIERLERGDVFTVPEWTR
jgi:hypothetical protein